MTLSKEGGEVIAALMNSSLSDYYTDTMKTQMLTKRGHKNIKTLKLCSKNEN